MIFFWVLVFPFPRWNWAICKTFVNYSPQTEYTTRAGYRQPRQSQATHHRTRAGRRRPLDLRAARGAKMCGSIPGSVGPRIQPHTARSTTAPKRCPTTAFRQRFTCQSVTVTAGSQKHASTRQNRRPIQGIIYFFTLLTLCAAPEPSLSMKRYASMPPAMDVPAVCKNSKSSSLATRTRTKNTKKTYRHQIANTGAG